MFGIGGGEFLMLVVLAVVLFGPEKIPEFSRKAARVVFYLRTIANNATMQLREELGPEYADLELSDLTPKAFLQRALLDDIQGDLDEIKEDLGSVRAELDASGREVSDAVKESVAAVSASVDAAQDSVARAAASAAEVIPFDSEAT